MQKRPFFSSKSVTGGGVQAVSFVCPSQLVGFYIDRISVRENSEMYNAGSSTIKIETVSERKQTTDKSGVNSQILQMSKPTSAGTGASGGSMVGYFTPLEPITVAGGDAIIVEVDMKDISAAQVDIVLCGSKVGAF